MDKSRIRDIVIKIIITGPVAWAFCIGAIAVSVVAILATPKTDGKSNFIHALTVPLVGAILGPTAAITAVSIAVKGRGVGVLKNLRNYKIEKHEGDVVVLKRK